MEGALKIKRHLEKGITKPREANSGAVPGCVVEIVQADDFVCIIDGQNAMYSCPACSGTDLLESFKFCPNCGVNIKFDL